MSLNGRLRARDDNASIKLSVLDEAEPPRRCQIGRDPEADEHGYFLQYTCRGVSKADDLMEGIHGPGGGEEVPKVSHGFGDNL